MASVEALLTRIRRKPKDYTVQELDTLLNKCGCVKGTGGRGSSLMYCHKATGRKLIFDGPHPGNELYPYQIKKVLAFLEDIGY